MSVALVVSTYELGGRPLGITGVAGALRAAGHEVVSCDLAVEPWPTAALMRADCLCCSVPMHTALRLTIEEVVRRAREQRPGLPVYYFGLYAGVAEAAGLLGSDDEAFERDEAAALVACCDRLDGRCHPREISSVPGDHQGLPPLGEYARFVSASEERLVATIATTSGCNHRCRHCPVPVVHHGRSVALPEELLLVRRSRRSSPRVRAMSISP